MKSGWSWAFGWALFAFGCSQPQVQIENGILAESGVPGGLNLVRDVSFRGCRWSLQLSARQRTPPCEALPGRGAVYFEWKWRLMAEDGGIEESWFRHKTRRSFEVGYNESHVLRLTASELEQDFSSTGPQPH